jgi:hypothetical protein
MSVALRQVSGRRQLGVNGCLPVRFERNVWGFPEYRCRIMGCAQKAQFLYICLTLSASDSGSCLFEDARVAFDKFAYQRKANALMPDQELANR